MPASRRSDRAGSPSSRLRSLLNFRRGAVDKTGVDQVSRPMQIALVAVVLLAGMWFTVLKPKSNSGSGSGFTPVAATPAATPATASKDPVAPGVKGLTTAIDKAKGASTTSDAANAKIQQATGSSPAASAPAAATPAPSAAAVKAKATATAAAKAKATAAAAAATAKAKSTASAKAKAKAAPATTVKTATVAVDPSDRLLAFLAKGKTLVILFHGAGADDRAARKAVHRTALGDPKHVVSAYIPIGDVGKYEAITSKIEVVTAPTILVIGTNGKATLLTGYVNAAVVRQAVGDARRSSAKSAKSAK
ncbi:MAG: hypothetical protein JWQ18_480 [Conexibacter sp.]|nr:hypothetical protein [Conexibacter sp.]